MKITTILQVFASNSHLHNNIEQLTSTKSDSSFNLEKAFEDDKAELAVKAFENVTSRTMPILNLHVSHVFILNKSYSVHINKGVSFYRNCIITRNFGETTELITMM